MQATNKPQIVTEQHTGSLLDQVVLQQATVASRYRPVMSGPEMKEREAAIDYLVQHVMKEGVDYGYVPGTKPTKQSAPGEYIPKPTLFKAGAERACAYFGYTPHFEEIERVQEWTSDKYGEPLCYREYRCSLSKDGAAIGEGIGSASSWESKYRYRQGERECPDCGRGGTIIRGKKEYGGGWLCFGKKGGCGAKFEDGDERIEGQATDKVANPDIADVYNVVLKMGQKRAYVAATLTATGLSGRFTQDLEDLTPPEPKSEPEPARTNGKPAPTPVATPKTPREQMLADMVNMGTSVRTLASLREKMLLFPNGEAEFKRILKKHCGVEDGKALVGLAKTINPEHVRAAAAEMWDGIVLAETLSGLPPEFANAE